MNYTGWPADLPWYKLLYDWQTIIAGVLALIAGFMAYRAGRHQANATRQAAKMQVEAERSKAKRELQSIRRALGVEVRLYTANALTAHCYCKSLIIKIDNESRIPSILIEDRASLPVARIYASAASKIGEFEDCAATLVRFFTSIAVVRGAADRLRDHPLVDNIPPSEIAKAADGLINIAEMGTTLFPFLKTGIESLDGTDADGVAAIEQAYKDWRSCREKFYPFRS